MKKALCFAMAVIAAISLILVSPLATEHDHPGAVADGIDAPGGG